ncbi:MAG: FAD-dependent thymidylate synthase [Atopobiaceae bacterium]|nr:FAD-dependent thymidylate synthase [Atopobiaceae bacterium]MBR3160098.1 FAD-dependent thymidylate synthase [Atopobiaceae bacterium]
MVEILRHPTEDDWERCRMLALNTVGKSPNGPVSDSWKHRMLRSRHSPKRTLMFTIRMDVPYWVSVHFVRHKIGVEHYVSTQRNDRQDRYDRNEAPQGMHVTHVMDIDADALIHMAHMRLCHQAADETRNVMREICDEVIRTNPEFEPFLKPKCLAYGAFHCDEFRPCGEVTKNIQAPCL